MMESVKSAPQTPAPPSESPPPVRRSAGRDAGSARRRLISAARAELIDGAGEAEIGAIAKRAGVSAGLAYHYFGSKDGLIAAVIEDFYARYSRVVNARVSGAGWAEREIQRTRAAVLFLLEHPFTPTLFGPLSRASAVVAAEQACIKRLIEGAARNIAKGQAGGDLPRQSDPRSAAAFVMGGMRQTIAAALASDPQPEPIALARQVWILIASSLGLRVASRT
jgi:AcrR family transcriptional regulator